MGTSFLRRFFIPGCLQHPRGCGALRDTGGWCREVTGPAASRLPLPSLPSQCAQLIPVDPSTTGYESSQRSAGSREVASSCDWDQLFFCRNAPIPFSGRGIHKVFVCTAPWCLFYMEAGTGCEGLCQAAATGPGGAWVAPGELWGAEGTGTAPLWCLWHPWVSWLPLGVMAALPCHGRPAPPLVVAILCVGRAHSGWGHVEGVWSWGGWGYWEGVGLVAKATPTSSPWLPPGLGDVPRVSVSPSSSPRCP